MMRGKEIAFACWGGVYAATSGELCACVIGLRYRLRRVNSRSDGRVVGKRLDASYCAKGGTAVGGWSARRFDLVIWFDNQDRGYGQVEVMC